MSFLEGSNVTGNPFTNLKRSEQERWKDREKAALAEAKRRIRKHERDEQKRVDLFGSDYIPEIKTLKPRSEHRRRYYRVFLAQGGFKYWRLPFDPTDFAQEDIEVQEQVRKKEKARAARGWDPLTQARGPFCHTDRWPWPHLPPHLVQDALHSYAKERALEELERDLNIEREHRFRVDEFLQAAGLDQEFYKHSLANALPSLPVNAPLFALGMQRALGYAQALTTT